MTMCVLVSASSTDPWVSAVTSAGTPADIPAYRPGIDAWAARDYLGARRGTSMAAAIVSGALSVAFSC
jgi:hypothetical protein